MVQEGLTADYGWFGGVCGAEGVKVYSTEDFSRVGFFENFGNVQPGAELPGGWQRHTPTEGGEIYVKLLSFASIIYNYLSYTDEQIKLNHLISRA